MRACWQRRGRSKALWRRAGVEQGLADPATARRRAAMRPRICSMARRSYRAAVAEMYHAMALAPVAAPAAGGSCAALCDGPRHRPSDVQSRCLAREDSAACAPRGHRTASRCGCRGGQRADRRRRASHAVWRRTSEVSISHADARQAARVERRIAATDGDSSAYR
jgi:hypothetical protein